MRIVTLVTNAFANSLMIGGIIMMISPQFNQALSYILFGNDAAQLGTIEAKFSAIALMLIGIFLKLSFLEFIGTVSVVPEPPTSKHKSPTHSTDEPEALPKKTSRTEDGYRE